HGEARSLDRLVLGDGPAVDRPQEVVEEALAGGRVVEDLAHQSRLRRLVDEVRQTLSGLIESLQEEPEHGGVPGRKLGGMQIPSLIDRMHEGMANMAVVEPPRTGRRWPAGHP